MERVYAMTVISKSIVHNPLKQITAGQVMTREIVTVSYDWSVDRLARFLTDRAISGAPVVDDAGQVIGVVSLSDIVRQTGNEMLDLSGRPDSFYQALHDCGLSEEELATFHETMDQFVMVNDIMTRVVFEISPDTCLSKVAEAMVTGHIHRVLITENRQLKGVVSALDILKVLSA
ncbi:Inosine-5'-monophosphate dehydrogenase [invertebrate metagenome]|uniref:Inosine-5'-monophosphate dehydrogenase n=1 Tax=invertebrate metagenome TaxID=1711999 RepID=A0A2H9TAW9_9ZZZZ